MLFSAGLDFKITPPTGSRSSSHRPKVAFSGYGFV